MSKIASQITSLTIVCSTVYSGPDQTKHQSFASLAFVRGIHRGLAQMASNAENVSIWWRHHAPGWRPLRHWIRWRQASAALVTTMAVILTIFPFCRHSATMRQLYTDLCILGFRSITVSKYITPFLNGYALLDPEYATPSLSGYDFAKVTADTWRNNNVIITSKRRRKFVLT